MKKFHVVVNGESFDVEIEEVGGETPSIPSAPAEPKEKPISAMPKAVAPKTAPPKPKASGASNEVVSPLPGTVLSINFKEGDTVNSGDVVLVIEAMKMENDIVAPEGGTILSIHVKKGDNVQGEDLLFVLG